MSSVISFHMKDNTLEPIIELPDWCYIDSEWNDIVNQTVCIIDGIRYKKKEPEQLQLEEMEDFVNAFLG